MAHDDSGVEHLKDALYSRKHQGPMSDVRAPLSASEAEAPKAWEGTQPVHRTAPKAGENAAARMALATKFLIGSAIFFIVAIVGALVFFFSGGNYISADNIDLQIVAPALADGGTASNLQFIVTNRNPSELQLADLVIDYPDGTRDPTDPTKSLLHQRISVGTLAAGRQTKLTATAAFYGAEGASLPIKATLEYSVPGSNAVFVKSNSANITIGSSPVSVRVDMPQEAIAGQSFTTTITVTSNAADPIQDVVVQAQYPFGYAVQSATPKAASGSTTWRLGTMAPGATQVITLVGTIDGQDGDERVFQFSVGTNKDQTASKISVPFISVPATLTVHRPFITGAISVNGKTGAKVSASAGSTLQGSINWQNNLSESVSDVTVKLKLSGAVLDPSTINPGSGFYQSSDGTITWTSAQDPSLAQVPPGGSGTLQFSFGTLPPGSGGVVYSNPVVDLALSMGATRAGGDAGVPNTVASADAMEVSLASAVSLSASAQHFTGPYTNTGPMPPRSGLPTTYSIVWTIKNSSNSLANTAVSTVLPTYVQFVAGQAGITYDSGSRTVRWDIGDVNAGVGYSSAALQGAFQVILAPSDSQVGSAPYLTGTSALSGTDRFAQTALTASADAPTTKLTENGFQNGMDIVQPKQ